MIFKDGFPLFSCNPLEPFQSLLLIPLRVCIYLFYTMERFFYQKKMYIVFIIYREMHIFHSQLARACSLSKSDHIPRRYLLLMEVRSFYRKRCSYRGMSTDPVRSKIFFITFSECPTRRELNSPRLKKKKPTLFVVTSSLLRGNRGKSILMSSSQALLLPYGSGGGEGGCVVASRLGSPCQGIQTCPI